MLYFFFIISWLVFFLKRERIKGCYDLINWQFAFIRAASFHIWIENWQKSNIIQWRRKKFCGCGHWNLARFAINWNQFKPCQAKPNEVKSSQSMGWTCQMINDSIKLIQVDSSGKRKKFARKYFDAHISFQCACVCVHSAHVTRLRMLLYS